MLTRSVLFSIFAALTLSQVSLAADNDQTTCNIQDGKIAAQYDATANKVTYTMSSASQPEQTDDGVSYQLAAKATIQKDENFMGLIQIAGLSADDVETAAVFTLSQSHDASFVLVKFNGKNNNALKTVLIDGWSAVPCQ